MISPGSRVERDPPSELHATTGGRVDRQRAAEDGDPFAHVREAGSRASSRLDVAADPVVDDRKAQLIMVPGELHLGMGVGAGMLAGVLESFQAAEVDGRLDVGRVAADPIGDERRGRYAASCRGASAAFSPKSRRTGG